VGEHDQAEAGDYAEAGEAVGEDVLSVGFEDEGVGALAGADEVVAEASVEDSGDEDHGYTVAEVLELEAVDPLADGLDEDGDGGDDDERAFKSSGEKGDVLVAVEEMAGGRFEAEAEAEAGETDGDDVDYRFRGVGKDGCGVGEEPGGGLAEKHEDAEGQREAHGEVGVADFRLVALGWEAVDGFHDCETFG